MASPPNFTYSPAGSPPGPAHTQLPSKKRDSSLADLPGQASSGKRRKPSTMSVTSATSAHPLRQTSFPPDDMSQAYSPNNPRSPSMDIMSAVSGSQVSSAPVKKKRGRKSKAEHAAAALRNATPSEGGGTATTATAAASAVDGAEGDGGADGGDDDGMPNPEMGTTSANRTKEQIQEQTRLRSILKSKMTTPQWDRYEIWHRLPIPMNPLRKYINTITSQSTPANVHQTMQTVAKVFVGDIIEEARRIQEEWIKLGEKQTNLPTSTAGGAEAPDPSGKNGFLKAPLRPEHLQEAYRRRKAAAETAGIVGSLHMWHMGTHGGADRFAPRAGGKRLFR